MDNVNNRPKKMSPEAKAMTILTLVLVVLVSVLSLVKVYSGGVDDIGTEDAEVLVDVATEDIIKFSYDYEGVTYTFEKVDDTWYYAEDHSLNITQYQISNMLSGVAPLEFIMQIDGVEEAAQYGLSESGRMLQYETADAQYTFELGGENQVVDSAYIRRPSDSTVYVVDSSVVTMFNKALEELVDEAENTEETAE